MLCHTDLSRSSGESFGTALTGKDARRIYEELDDFQTRRPIDVIAANRPVLILDEPQKMGGGATRRWPR